MTVKTQLLRVSLTMLSLFKKKKKRRIILRPKGDIYDLAFLYDSINQQYFNGKLSLHISWFGTGQTVPKTKITFGLYNFQHKLIKINRLLDREEVPLNFVRYIIYHEMLHEIHPPKRRKKGFHHIHHLDFKLSEKRFAEYEEAQAFLKVWKTRYFSRKNSEPVNSYNATYKTHQER